MCVHASLHSLTHTKIKYPKSHIKIKPSPSSLHNRELKALFPFILSPHFLYIFLYYPLILSNKSHTNKANNLLDEEEMANGRADEEYMEVSDLLQHGGPFFLDRH